MPRLDMAKVNKEIKKIEKEEGLSWKEARDIYWARYRRKKGKGEGDDDDFGARKKKRRKKRN
jgi:hypothetical protein